MKVLITGSGGFLGTELIRELNKKGIDTVHFDVGTGDDILSEKSLESKVTDGVTDIIHLAAVADLNLFRDDTDTGYKINVEGTRNVLRVAEEKKIPVLFAGTCCSYGDNQQKINQETSPVCPTEDYAKSKVISEKDIVEARGKSGIKHVSMRLCTFYGGAEMRRALAIALFIEKIYKKESIRIFGTGNQRRCYGHYTTVVDGIMTVLFSDKRYDIVNIAPSDPYSVWDILSTVLNEIRAVNDHKLAPEVRLTVTEGRGSEEFDQGSIDNSRLRDLGWQGDRFTFQEGIRESIKAFINNEYKWIK